MFGFRKSLVLLIAVVVLARMLGPLAEATATLQVTDAKSEGAEAGELAYFALRQVLQKVEDQAALTAVISPMTEALYLAFDQQRGEFV